MRQQVNFFRPPPRAPGWLSVRRMGQLVGGLAAVLLVHTAVRGVQLNWLNREVAELEQRQEGMATRLEESKRNDVAPQVAALRDELARLTLARDQRIQVLDRLNKGGFGNLSGFSPLLRGFARQRVDGLWFTELHLAEGGSQLTVHGFSMADTLIPDFLQKLREETAMNGLVFRHIQLRRVERGDAPIAFELSTQESAAAVRLPEAGG